MIDTDQCETRGRELVAQMRAVRMHALRRLDEFTVLTDQLAELVETNPECVLNAHVPKQVLEALDSVAHQHSGGSEAMHARLARDVALNLRIQD